MSSTTKRYGNSDFMILIKVTTLIKKGVSIPDEAKAMMKDSANKLCKKQNCQLVDMEMDGDVLRFSLEVTPQVGDLGHLIGAIKSIWSRTLRRDYDLSGGVWLPRYLIISTAPGNLTQIENDWIEKVRNTNLTDEKEDG